jgi:hypothetical protein
LYLRGGLFDAPSLPSAVGHAIETDAQESCMEALELEVRLAVGATETKSFRTKMQPPGVA